MAEQFNKKYSAGERQAYHNKLAKVGAVKKDKNTGDSVPVSDFERGAHKAKANMIFKARKKTFIKKNPDKQWVDR